MRRCMPIDNSSGKWRDLINGRGGAGMKLKGILKSIVGIPEQDCTPAGMIIEKLLLAVILVIPLRYTLSLFFDETNRQLAHMAGYRTAVFCAIAIFLILSFLSIAGSKSRLTRSAEAAVVVSICFMAFLLRVIACTMLRTMPVSDFLCCYNYAVSHQNAAYMTNYSYLGIYALTIRAFMAIFGQSVMKAQMLAVAITSLIPATIYITAKSAFHSARIGIISALLFAIFPSMIIYTGILSGENIAMFFFALTIMLLALAWRNRHENKRYWLLIGFTGVSAGFMNLYKPLLIIIIAALAIAEFVFYICPAIRNCFKAKRFLAKEIITPVLVLVIIYTLGTLITAAGNFILFKDSGLQPTVKITYVERAFAGLYSKGQGVHNLAVRAIIDDVKSSSSTAAESDARLLQMLKSDVNADSGAFRLLLKEKYIVDWCDESIYIHWATIKDDSILDVQKALMYLSILPSWFYILLVVAITAGMAIRLFHHGKGAYPYLLLSCIYLLMCCMFFIIEAQGRYKSVIMPLFCILAAVGLSEIAMVSKAFFTSIMNLLKKKQYGDD